MKTGDLIKQRREALGMTQQELAELVGYKDRASICLIEGNKREVKQKAIVKFAKALNVRPSSLIGDIDGIGGNEFIKLNKIPMLGNIACGNPALAVNQYDTFCLVDENTKADFCLKVKGDSMIDAGIKDGDIVFCKSQKEVENGEIAVVIIKTAESECEATLKRCFYYPEMERLILIPENKEFTPLTFTGAELNNVEIIGKAVVCQHKL